MPLTNPDNVVNLAASNTTFAVSNNTVNFSGQGAVVVGTAANQVNISAPAQTAQTQSNIQSIAASNTTYQTGQVEFTGSNIVTVKSSANQRVVIDASVAAQTVQTQNLVDVSVSANASTSGALALVSSGTLLLQAGPNITLSQNAQTLQISGPTNDLAFYVNMPGGAVANMTNITAISKQPIYFPLEIDGNVTLNNVFLEASRSTSGSDLMSIHMGIYTAANATSLNLIASASQSYSVSLTASNSGLRSIAFKALSNVAGVSTLSKGDYIAGLYFSAAATASMNYSLRGVAAGALGVVHGGADQVSIGTSQNYPGVYGRHSVTLGGLPANVVRSDVVNQGVGASGQLVPQIVIAS